MFRAVSWNLGFVAVLAPIPEELEFRAEDNLGDVVPPPAGVEGYAPSR